MTVIDQPAGWNPQEDAWNRCEAAAVAAMTSMNLAAVALVRMIAELLETDGWHGWGINSPEHWVCWKANVSKHRAQGLVQIARRRTELPKCWALFEDGRLTEDSMVRIAKRVPASRDGEVAGLAPNLMISQLTRILSCLPELEPTPPPPERDRFARIHTHTDGWGESHMSLPPDEWAALLVALGAARDAEFRDRKDLPTDTEVTEADARSITWADAVVRMASEATDGLDATFQRTGHRGERNQVVLHHHVRSDGTLGPGRLHLAGHVTDSVARYLACDAQVIVVAYRDGKLLGINPSERTPNRRMRRYLEHRDGGCAHPLCEQRRWLHAHHIQHWEDDGPTEAWNLICLCPAHHRALHHLEFSIEGNPEDGTVVFRDRFGRAIEPPEMGAKLPHLPPPTKLTYDPPCGERLNPRDFNWN
jgi:hypothetical protein